MIGKVIGRSAIAAGRGARAAGRGGVAAGNKLGSSKKGLALVAAGGFAAGIGSTDPVKGAMSTFESSVMGDPNFSTSILGGQMGPYGALGLPGARGFSMNQTLFNNAARYRNTSANMRQTAPGSMVFGMFNSRM